MSEWKEYKLGDIIELITKGTTPTTIGGRFVDKGVNFIKSESVSYDGRIDKSKFMQIDEVTHHKLKRSQLAKDDILFSMAGIFLGKNALVTEDLLPANTNQALAIIRVNKEKVIPKYIHYYLRQPIVIDFVNNMSGQSAQPNINFEEIKSIDIYAPNLTEQAIIASCLGSLDDKISLLHRQNATLEAMAETLFRQWFIVESVEIWETKKLGELITITRGASPRPIVQYVQNGTVAWIKIADATSSNSFYINSTKEFISEAGASMSVRVHPGDLVLSNSATCGLPYFVELEGCIHDGWLLFRDFRILSKYFVFFFLKQINKELNSIADGSVQDNLNTGMLKEYPVKVPDRKKLQQFDEIIMPIITKMKSNNIQVQTLTTLRDTLLPKLMSGEVRVAI